jgi:hypothetical protein
MAGFSVPNFSAQNSPFDLNEALSSAMRDKLMKAQARKAEAETDWMPEKYSIQRDNTNLRAKELSPRMMNSLRLLAQTAQGQQMIMKDPEFAKAYMTMMQQGMGAYGYPGDKNQQQNNGQSPNLEQSLQQQMQRQVQEEQQENPQVQDDDDESEEQPQSLEQRIQQHMQQMQQQQMNQDRPQATSLQDRIQAAIFGQRQRPQRQEPQEYGPASGKIGKDANYNQMVKQAKADMASSEQELLPSKESDEEDMSFSERDKFVSTDTNDVIDKSRQLDEEQGRVRNQNLHPEIRDIQEDAEKDAIKTVKKELNNNASVDDMVKSIQQGARDKYAKDFIPTDTKKRLMAGNRFEATVPMIRKDFEIAKDYFSPEGKIQLELDKKLVGKKGSKLNHKLQAYDRLEQAIEMANVQGAFLENVPADQISRGAYKKVWHIPSFFTTPDNAKNILENGIKLTQLAHERNKQSLSDVAGINDSNKTDDDYANMSDEELRRLAG